MKFFKPKKMTAYEAISEAQKIAYSPLTFQAARVLRDLGILKLLEESGSTGTTLDKITDTTGLSLYGIEVLIDSGLSMGIVEMKNETTFILGKIGHYLLNDEMTRINMDYNHYICYQGMYYLDKAIKEGKPSGLKVFGKGLKTLYQILPQLAEREKSSWYAFDHFYSDSAYPAALNIVLQNHPKTIVDIGANNGKFSILAATSSPDLQLTMIDLHDQLQIAIENIRNERLENRVDSIEMDLLDAKSNFPTGKDIYWLSQVLSCFGKDEIVSILKRIADAMDNESTIYILETCWDRQQHAAAAFSLINTSLYFTAIASGNSKMYSSRELGKCIDAAGLTVKAVFDDLGMCHILFECKKKMEDTV